MTANFELRRLLFPIQIYNFENKGITFFFQ